MESLEEILRQVRAETGTSEDVCPLCGSKAFEDATGVCEDCGTDILKDWALGEDA